MRTNITLNDDLIREASCLSQAGSKSALMEEEAMRFYVEARSEERRRVTYEDHLLKVHQICLPRRVDGSSSCFAGK
jgi:hypothetical protein